MITGGKMLNRDPEFRIGLNGYGVYNNSGGTAVRVTRIPRDTDEQSRAAPTRSSHIMRYSFVGGNTSPNFGGFVRSTMSRANAVFIHRIIANVPVGYSLRNNQNNVGVGAKHEWLTSREGTGMYQEYLYRLTCGATPGATAFSTFGHISIELRTAANQNTHFNVDVAYAAIYDMTEHDDAADRATAITDKFGTTMDGGLINTVKIELREANSKGVTAGINGIQGANSNNPAFWAGGTFAQAQAGTAKAIITHNGKAIFNDARIRGSIETVDALLGNVFRVRKDRIAVLDPANPTVERWAFSRDHAPNVTDLLGQTTDSGSITVPARWKDFTLQHGVHEQIVPISNSNLVVRRNESVITVGASSFRIIADKLPERMFEVTLMIMLNNFPFITIASTTNFHPNMSFTARTFPRIPAGTYSLAFVINNISSLTDLPRIDLDIQAVPFSWNFTQAGFQQFEFGRDGLTAFYSQNHLSFTENRGLDVRGQTNMPGVLLSGTGLMNGGIANRWGARWDSRNVQRVSTGVYDVFHSIGHTEYAVSITPVAGSRVGHIVSRNTDRFRVEIRTNAGTPALVNSNFDFIVSGRNY